MIENTNIQFSDFARRNQNMSNMVATLSHQTNIVV